MSGYGRLTTAGGSSGGGNATEGAVITQVPELSLAKTNLIVASGDFTNAAWVNAGLALTANSTVAPNGATQADTLDDNSAVAIESIAQTVTIPNDALPYTASCYFALGTSGQVRIQLDLTGGVALAQSADFNPANGAQLAAAGTGTIEVETLTINGVFWQRVSVTLTNNASGNVNAVLTISPASANVASLGTVIAWGAQVEQNNGPTDLIQTDIAALARRAGRMPPYLIDHAYGIRNVATNYILDADMDNGRMILATTSVTLTLPGLATAGPGWAFTFKNAGTGTITMNGTTATELIRAPGNALAGTTALTFPYSGTGTGPYNVSGGAIMVDGAATLWEMVNTLETHGAQIFTTNGTWVCPVGVNTGWIDAAAGGGGSGSATTGVSGSAGGGGAAGNSAVNTLVVLVPGTNYAVTIGNGGTGANATTNQAGNGTSTSFGALLTLLPGNGGTSGGASTGGNGGTSNGVNAGNGCHGLLQSVGNQLSVGGAGGGNDWASPQFNNVYGGSTGVAGVRYGGGAAGASQSAGAVIRAGADGAPGFIAIRW